MTKVIVCVFVWPYIYLTIKTNNIMKAAINFEGKDQKIVNYKEFEQILNSVNMNWFGIKNWSRGDLDLFEQKYDGLTCEPTEKGIKIWDRDFNYSPLYKK